MKWNLKLIVLLLLILNYAQIAEGNIKNCTVNCVCCTGGQCGPKFGFTNACTNGCIDGYAYLNFVSPAVECTRSDINCEVDCACCIDVACGSNQWFSSGVCTNGCLDGYAGARCFKKCPVNCIRCVSESNKETCKDCHDGYHPGPDNDCTTECLPNCKTCTSGSSCTSCEEGYENKNGSDDCHYRTCPGNCKCENGKCASCIDGYYGTSNSCNSQCPRDCLTCSSDTDCNSCKDGHYNGRQYDDNSQAWMNDCTNDCRNNCTQCSSSDVCSFCKTGHYGVKCDKSCSVGCSSKSCDIQTGNCDCSSNFVGDKCDRCKDGQYGDMCDKLCSTGCKNDVCEKTSGNCTDGCIAGTIDGAQCDVCATGWYGSNCNLSCSVGCKSNICRRTDGECTDECLDNFKGNKCDECINGKYGKQCKINCADNCDDKGCKKDSGNCIECVQNFDGVKCDRCVVGFYDPTCSKNCPSKCFNNTCEKDSGTCTYGCVDNYSGDNCCVNNNNCMLCSSDTSCKQCKSGYYNDQCNKTCPDNCLDSCNIVTGKCDKCRRNFYGEQCYSSCSSTCNIETLGSESQCQQMDGKCLNGCNDGFYSNNCTRNCSILCKNLICKRDDGTCTNGCQKEVKDDQFCPLISVPDPPDPPIGGIVGGVVGALVAIAVVVIVVFIMYRRRQNGRNKGESPDLEKTQASRTSRSAEQAHTYGNISNVENATPQPKTKTKPERKSASAPVPPVNTRESKNDIRQPLAVSTSLDVNDVTLDEVVDNNQADDPYYNIAESPYRIKVGNLLDYVTSKNVDFEAEFKKLNKDLDLTKYCTVAKQPQNIALNRYNGIYPYDHSRVTIPAIPDFFMNACYIDGYGKEKEYIASLGPTLKTTANFATFWLMVWYEKTDIIVMLTNLREASGMKCEQYWPEAETEAVYGDITIKCRSIEEFAEYSVRTYTVIKGKERRQVIQLHFTAWPDKSVPQEVTSLVEFRQRVNVVPKTLGGPIIVHCSAGVGRTGTYIGLDTLTKEGKERCSVDVVECVNRMRYQRVNMVQTAEQYKFLHKALVHALSFGCETMTAEKIQKIMYDADANTFSNIYKSLAQEVDMDTKDEVTAREENKKRYKDKNRRQSGIPGNGSRVRLFLARKVGQHDYINAVFINSFKIKNMFIASQTPLPGTIEDFISMIFQQDTACVVALEDQNNPSKDIGQYLPADNETYTFGNFSVTSSKSETKSQYILKNLTIKDYAKDQKKSVYHFQYKNWQTPKKIPDSATDFVQFVKEVGKYVSNDPQDQANVIAHCLNGYERTGLFCIVYKLLEKLEAERQVSVVNTVRMIRTHRRQSITSVEQLKFCFECITAYLETYDTYTNFAS